MKLEKVTKITTRWYEDACAAAHALDLVGERWALLVMRELMFGAKRFGDLRASLPGISANILTQRLETLESAGVVIKRRLPPPAAVQVYELTEWGRESEPIFQALGRWGARSPAHDPTLPFSANSFLMSLRTMLDPVLAGGLDVHIVFAMGEDRFTGHLAEGRIEVERGERAGADVIFTAPPPVLAAAFYRVRTLAALEAQGALRITGDRGLAQRLTGLFPLPEKARAPG